MDNWKSVPSILLVRRVAVIIKRKGKKGLEKSCMHNEFSAQITFKNYRIVISFTLTSPCTRHIVSGRTRQDITGGPLMATSTKSQHVSAEDGEWFHCPDIGRDLFPPLRCQNRRGVMTSLSALCLLSAMAVPADVEEQSTGTEACGLTSVWR